MNDPSQDYGYPTVGEDHAASTRGAGSGQFQANSPAQPVVDFDYELPESEFDFDSEFDSDPNSDSDRAYGYPTPPGSQGWDEPVWGRPIWGPAPSTPPWPQDGSQAWVDQGYPEDDRRGYPLSEYILWAKSPPATQEPSEDTDTVQPKQSRRGTVALALAMAALGLALILAAWAGQAFAQGDRLFGGNFDLANPEPTVAGLTGNLSYAVLGLVVPAVLGLIALILGMTGLRTTSRGAAVGAIMLALLAPMFAFMVFVVVSASGAR